MRPPVVGSFFLHLSAVDSLDVLTLRNSFGIKKKKKKFPEVTELLLVGCSIELVWTPKSNSNTSTPENEFADILTKGNFTRDEWNHLLTLFLISAILALLLASQRWQNELNKNQEKDVSQPNHDP